MAKVAQYRRLIQEVLTEYGQFLAPADDENIEIQIILDTVRDHYQID